MREGVRGGGGGSKREREWVSKGRCEGGSEGGGKKKVGRKRKEFDKEGTGRSLKQLALCLSLALLT